MARRYAKTGPPRAARPRAAPIVRLTKPQMQILRCIALSLSLVGQGEGRKSCLKAPKCRFLTLPAARRTTARGGATAETAATATASAATETVIVALADHRDDSIFRRAVIAIFAMVIETR